MVAQTKPHAHQRYCPSCGRLLEPNQDVCPSCGMRVITPQTLKRSTPRKDGQKPASQKRTEPQLKSSLPSQEEVKRSQQEASKIQTKHLLVSVISCVLVICGAVLLITHPWDPNAFSPKAENANARAQDGTLEEIPSLTGQDSKDVQDETSSQASASVVYSALSGYYRQLNDLNSKLEAATDNLLKSLSQKDDARKANQDEVSSIQSQIASLSEQIDNLDVSGTNYATTLANIQEAAKDLKEYADALYSVVVSASVLEKPQNSSDQVQNMLDSMVTPKKDAYAKAFKKIKVVAPTQLQAK